MKRVQEAIYKELLNAVLVRNKREAEEALLANLVADQDFPLPPSLLTIHRKACLLGARRLFTRQGFHGTALEQRLAECAQEQEEDIQRRARTQALLMAYGYREQIVVSEQDMEREVEKLANASRQNADRLRDELYRTGAVYELQDRVLADKALHQLYSRAKKCVVDSEGQPVPQPEVRRE